MATSSTRQRKLARAKYERQQARKAEHLRRQRQIRAAIAGGIALVVAIVGGLWLGGVFDKKTPPAEAGSDCQWQTQNLSANDKLTDEGTPPKTVNKFGTSTMNITLATGTITAKLSNTDSQCGVASAQWLADKGYYNGTKCFELSTGPEQYALRCGDKSETGIGGAGYTFGSANVPKAVDPSASPAPSAAPGAQVRYKRGQIAMYNTISGSQFFVFYKDSTTSANYSIIGEVTGGLDVLDKIAEAGVKENANKVKVQPVNDVVIQSLTVTADQAAAPSETPTPSASAS